MNKYLFISRDARFSPNSVEKDQAILQAVARRLTDSPLLVAESELEAAPESETYVTMARLTPSLHWLEDKEKAGRRVINSASGVLRCGRSDLETLMRQHHLPMPPTEGPHGYWLKRGDTAAQERGDVIYCPDKAALASAKRQFQARGISRYTVSAHMEGDVVKFYAVGDRFFRCFYPSDDHQSKFGDEQVNGRAHHYPFSQQRLHGDVVRLAELVGVEVYGGDAIVDEGGNYYIIDFNDWPSFSRCREEAAAAIAQLILKK